MLFSSRIWALFTIACFFIGFSSDAHIRLPALVGDHMVLQQNTTITLWGWSSPDENITIEAGWLNKSYQTQAGNTGRWKLDLPTGSAGGPYTLTLSGDNTIALKDIMLGEVWLCSGQSNMFFQVAKKSSRSWLSGVVDYENEVTQANFPKLRLFTVETAASQNLEEDVQGSWKTCTPESVATFSAVAYFFGRDLLTELNVPVGLISSSWGGTKAESWMPKENLAATDSFKPILERYAAEQNAYTEKLEAYTNAIANQADEILQKPKKAEANKAPYVLYNAMIHPLLNYKIKGAIWYQGESNAGRAYQYRSLFPEMVASWRASWGLGEFPFYYVQIAPHHGQNPEIREAQLMALNRIPNSGMVVSADHGNPKDIHPRNKKPIGKRLATWALANTYDRDFAYSGPLYDHYLISNDTIEIYFKYGEGLRLQGDTLTAIEIAGEDGSFYTAQARIEKNHLIVFSPEVDKPVSVRYGWENSPEINLFNAADLPASPFRTDDWPQPTTNKF